MPHVTTARVRWRHALATALATVGLTAGGAVVAVQAAPEPSPADRSQVADERRGNPDAYKFFRFGRKVVHWNRCGAIGYKVYRKGIPRKGISDAREAMRRINRASGLKFRYRGTTRAKPKEDGAGYPARTALVIGWVPAKGVGGSAAGLGGWQANRRADITSGFVKLNRSVRLEPGFGSGSTSEYVGTMGQLIMHEAAHAVGLQHVKDKRQIMYPQMRSRPATWGAGDFNGLRKLGRLRTCR